MLYKQMNSMNSMIVTFGCPGSAEAFGGEPGLRSTGLGRGATGFESWQVDHFRLNANGSLNHSDHFCP